MLSGLLQQNPALTDLDLAHNTKLPDRVLHTALVGSATALTRLNLAGCTAVSALYIPMYCPALRVLNLRNTATSDADVSMIAQGLSHLQALDIAGCMQVSDTGVSALANACFLGSLVSLGLAELPRVTAQGFGRLLPSWLCARQLHCGHVHDMDSTVVAAAQDTTAAAAQAACLPAQYHAAGACSLVLDVSHCGGLTDAVVAAMGAAVITTGGGTQTVTTSVSKWCHHVSCTDDHTHRGDCDHHGVCHDSGGSQYDDEDDVEDLSTAMSSLSVVASCAAGSVSFRELSLAGCTKISAAALCDLARTGCLHGLVTLDLSHFEGLRQPYKGPYASAIARHDDKCAGTCVQAGTFATTDMQSISMPQPAASAGPGIVSLASLTGPHLSVLKLDGCYLHDDAAAYLALRCPLLHSLSVIGCKGLGNAGLQAFAQHCQHLQDLSVGGVSSLWQEHIALAGLCRLITLKIARRSLLQDVHLMPVLAANQQLHSLSLVGCYSLTDAALVAAPASLRKLTVVACDGMTGSSICRLTGLRTLRLNGCPSVTCVALQHVLACCQQLVLLEPPAHLGSSSGSMHANYSWLPHQGPGGHLQGLKIVSNRLSP